MFMEASGFQPGHESHLFTPELPAADNYCVSFYFHLFGYHIGELRIEELLGSINDNPLQTNVVARYTLADTTGMPNN